MKQVTGNSLSLCIISNLESFFTAISNLSPNNKLCIGRSVVTADGTKGVIVGALDASSNKYQKDYNKVTCDRVLIQYFDNKANKYRIKPIEINKIQSHNEIDEKWFTDNVSITIKDAKLSAEAFGLLKTKSSLIGNTYDYYKISQGSCKWLDGQISYFIEVPHATNEAEYIKFAVRDIKFNFPEIGKGYNPPKDKSIKIGSIVRKFNNKNKVYTVVKFSKNPRYNPSKLSGKINKWDIATIQTPTGAVQDVYVKSLKIVK